MENKGLVDRLEGTEIAWKDGCDPTRKKIKKKKKGKKVNVEVQCDSFFNFFKNEPSKQPGEGEGDEKEEDGAPDDEEEEEFKAE